MTEQQTAAAVEALRQAISDECSKRGGSCNSTPEGLLSVNATFDPVAVVRALLKDHNA